MDKNEDLIFEMFRAIQKVVNNPEDYGNDSFWPDFLKAYSLYIKWRYEKYSQLNDKIYGKGNWIECGFCRDALDLPSYHHKDMHVQKNF